MNTLHAPLTESEIKLLPLRVWNSNGTTYAEFLAYKDARVDVRRLNETYGDSWEVDVEPIVTDSLVFFKVSLTINGTRRSTVVGAPVSSITDENAVKALVSDGLKRAGFLWGIGLELYDFPRIIIRVPNEYVYESKNGNPSIKDRFLRELRLELNEDGTVRVFHKENMLFEGRR